MYAPSFMERLAFPRRDTCFCAYPSFPQSVRRTRICTGPAAVVSFCSSFYCSEKPRFPVPCSVSSPPAFCLPSSPSCFLLSLSLPAHPDGASQQTITATGESPLLTVSIPIYHFFSSYLILCTRLFVRFLFFLRFFLDKYRPMVYSTVVYKFHINIQSASKEDPSFGERGNSGEIPGRSGHCNQGVKHNKSIVCPQHMRRNVER